MWKRRKEKWLDFVRKFARNKAAVLGFVIAMIFILLAVFADGIGS